MTTGTITLGRREGRGGGAISHSAVLAVLLMVFVLLMLALATFGSVGPLEGDALVYATFGVNLVLGLACFVFEVAKRPFSIMQVHWVFYLTFFVIAPLSQYAHGYAPWGYVLSDADYQLANILLLAWGILFAGASMRSGGNRRSYEGFSSRFYAGLPKVTTRAMCALVALALIATALVVYYVGFANLFSRSTFSTGLEQTASLLFDKGVRAIPVFVFALAVVRCKQRGKVDSLAVTSFALLLIAAFPAGMARYNAATIYGGLALLALAPLMERKGAFPLLFLLALLVVFPASNVYRTSGFGVAVFLDQALQTVSNLSLGFCTGDYDAYSMFARALHYINFNGISGGFQLLSVLLFFVPRSLWPAKGVGTGAMVATSQGQAFVNVSCPLPGEALVNFGILGIVLFAIAFGLLCRKLDEWFYEGSGGGRVFYAFACMLFFFMLRGDLLSSWAYTAGYLVCFAVLLFVCSRLSAEPCGGR